jgi:outer membrane lipoprotein-sorting protein
VAGAAVLLFAGASPAWPQTVDEIVARNLAARGGVEKLRSIDTVKSVAMVTGRDGVKVRVTTWVKRPDKMRRETEFPGRTLTVAFDGNTVWGLDSVEGVARPITGPQADATREQASPDPLFLDYKEKGYKIELAGTETINGTAAYHLTVTRKDGHQIQYYVSADTGLDLRTVETFERGGQKLEARTDLSNYQTVEGLPVPYTIKQYANGNLVTEVTFEKVEFNVPVDEAMFRLK